MKKKTTPALGDSVAASPRRVGKYALHFSGTGKTKQSFKDECDVNRIVSRFAETGLITHAHGREPQYGFASAQSFTEAAYIVAESNQIFEALPSETRAHFKNSVIDYLDAVEDPERQAELAELGLIPPLPEPIPSDEVALDEPTLVPPSDEAPNPPPNDEKDVN